MKLSQYMYFVSVAQTLNFTEAARIHFMTQPAISRQIAELEKELGVTLITRNNHGVTLTKVGEEFYHEALNILDTYQLMKARLENIADGPSDHIKISALPPCVQDLSRCLEVFSERYPQVHVEVDMSMGFSQLSDINQKNYDLYFSSMQILKSGTGIRHFGASRDQFCLLVHHRDAERADPGDFTALAERPLVMESRDTVPGLFDKTYEICRNRGRKHNNTIVCGDFLTVIAYVNAGMGFTIQPNSLASTCYKENLTILPLAGNDAWRQNAIGWSHSQRREIVKKFVVIAKELFT